MDSDNQNRDLEGISDRKAKTHKGRRYLDKFKPQIKEETRNCLLLRGNKTTEVVNKALEYFVK
jgi:hypothetical protein